MRSILVNSIYFAYDDTAVGPKIKGYRSWCMITEVISLSHGYVNNFDARYFRTDSHYGNFISYRLK